MVIGGKCPLKPPRLIQACSSPNVYFQLLEPFVPASTVLAPFLQIARIQSISIFAFRSIAGAITLQTDSLAASCTRDAQS